MRVLEAIVVIITIISTITGVFWFMDNRHQQAEESNVITIELKKELLDRDIKKDAEARVYYKDIELERPLTQAEQRRLNYLEEQLELKYDDQKLINETLIKLKSE